MSYIITVKGIASTDHFNLKELDGIDCQDSFSEYFDKTSYSDVVTGGYMYFKYSEGKLWTITIYDSSRELTQEELDNIGDYTQGQWSDGIGEGFEQQSCMEDDNGEEVFISPWCRGQVLEVSQSINSK